MATRIYIGNTKFSLTLNTLWAIYSFLSKGKRVLLSRIVLTNLIPFGRSFSSPPPLHTSFYAYSTWEGLVLAVVFRKPLHQSSLFKNKTKEKEFDAFTFKWHLSSGLSFTQWSTHIWHHPFFFVSALKYPLQMSPAKKPLLLKSTSRNGLYYNVV